MAEPKSPGLYERLSNAFQALMGNVREDTTQAGATVPSPFLDKYRKRWAEPQDNRENYKKIDDCLKKNPMLRFALRQYCRGAVGDAFAVTIDRAPTDILAAGAGRVITRLNNRCGLNSQNQNFAECMGTYGNFFGQRLVNEEREIVSVLQMPVEGFERLSDDCDQFRNPNRAFLQRDTASLGKIFYFPEWQIGHGRLFAPKGKRYGISLIDGALDISDNAMASALELRNSRRLSRPIDVHQFDPKTSITDTKLNYYIDETSKRRMLERDEKPEELRDYYIVGGTIQRLASDANLDKITDVELQMEIALAPTGTSPQQISFDRNANVGVLVERYRQLYANQAQFAGAYANEVLVPLYRFALLLAGIDPDQIEYTITFGQKYIEEDLRERNKQALDDFKAGRIDLKTSVKVAGAFYGEKPEIILSRLEAGKKQDDAPVKGSGSSQGATASGLPTEPENDLDSNSLN